MCFIEIYYLSFYCPRLFSSNKLKTLLLKINTRPRSTHTFRVCVLRCSWVDISFLWFTDHSNSYTLRSGGGLRRSETISHNCSRCRETFRWDVRVEGSQTEALRGRFVLSAAGDIRN